LVNAIVIPTIPIAKLAVSGLTTIVAMHKAIVILVKDLILIINLFQLTLPGFIIFEFIC
jgi:hypothetical protein